ncbi:MAG TPA: hypothetical protein VEV45_20845 [Streptosporangiaceae bacterium]|nr:hypothetical protein [Streptosporangiaceae bacterium]
MAGERRQRGPGGTLKPRRCDARVINHEREVQSAPTGKRQAAAAFDYWRSMAVRHPDAERLFNEMATDLTERARAVRRAA